MRRALDGERGGVFVADLLGGHEAEGAAAMPRHNEVTGASFLWEQEAYDPVTRHIRAYITLRDPATRKVTRGCCFLYFPPWMTREQEAYGPVTRHIRAYIMLRDPRHAQGRRSLMRLPGEV